MAARRLIGQILKSMGVIHEGMIQESLAIQREKGGRIGELLIELGHLDSTDLVRGLASQAGLAFRDLKSQAPDPAAVSRLDSVTARTFGVVPVAVEGGKLTVAFADPVNIAVLEDIGFATGMEVEGVIADETRSPPTTETSAFDRTSR